MTRFVRPWPRKQHAVGPDILAAPGTHHKSDDGLIGENRTHGLDVRNLCRHKFGHRGQAYRTKMSTYLQTVQKERLVGADRRRPSRRCQKGSDRTVGARKAPTVSSVPERLRPSRRCQKAPTVSPVPERLRPSRRCQKGSDRLVGARKAPTSRLKRRHTAATRERRNGAP